MDHEFFVKLRKGLRVEIRDAGDVWVRGVIDEQIGENFMVLLEGYKAPMRQKIDFTSEVRIIP
jgi:hypothetical protein